MEIIKAVEYGERTVIRVCLNPGEPEWVHYVGSQSRDGSGGLEFKDDGSPLLITSRVVLSGETGETCHNCRYNWDITEVILEGADLYGVGVDGEPLRLSDDQLVVAACARVAASPTQRVLDSLVGRSD